MRDNFPMSHISAKDDPSRVGRYVALYGALLVAAALVITASVLYRQNNLAQNGRWASSKIDLEYGVIGAVATMVTRVPLAGNHLDLGAYMGFQEFWLEDTRSVREIAFSVRFDEPSYFDILVGEKRSRFAGIRLSRHPEFESLFFNARDGEFVESTALDLDLGSGWRQWVDVRLDIRADSIGVKVGGRIAGQFPLRGGSARSLGFRGALEGPRIDDIEITFEDASQLTESFAYTKGAMTTFGVVIVLLMTATRFGYWLLHAVGGKSPTTSHLACSTALLVVLVCVSMFASADRYYFSHRYPKDYRALAAAGYPNRIEQIGDSIKRIDEEVGATAFDEQYRILLIGSSQTWGAGARSFGDTWAQRLQQTLNSNNHNVRVVNAGISGVRAGWLMQQYLQSWRRLDPDLIIVNLGHNDANDAGFGKAMLEFAGQRNHYRKHVVFILEPNSTESTTTIGERHDTIRRLAKNGGVQVVDMHAYLQEQRQAGHIWWDRVHLTNFGQRLFAEHLASELERQMGKSFGQ